MDSMSGREIAADVIEVLISLLAVNTFAWRTGFIAFELIRRSLHLIQLYGGFGLFIFYFGSRTTWRTQAQILGELDDEQALAFKRLVQDECTMISVAAAIVAQIALTGLSLNKLSQTHWVARGFFIFSLTSALMAVYYATTQQRIMGRLLNPKQIRMWVRGGSMERYFRGINFEGFFHSRLVGYGGGSQVDTEQNQNTLDLRSNRRLTRLRFLYGPRQIQSDPVDYEPGPVDLVFIEDSVIRQCFLPGVTSVITLSAPQGLLTGSLLTLLTGLGIYFGFTWTRGLDTDAGENDSRNVFITYIVTVGVCLAVYSISMLIQEDATKPEREILHDYMTKYLDLHPEILVKWGCRLVDIGGKRHLIAAENENGNETTTSPSEDTRGEATDVYCQIRYRMRQFGFSFGVKGPRHTAQ